MIDRECLMDNIIHKEAYDVDKILKRNILPFGVIRRPHNAIYMIIPVNPASRFSLIQQLMFQGVRFKHDLSINEEWFTAQGDD